MDFTDGIARTGRWFWRFFRFDAGAGLILTGLFTLWKMAGFFGSIGLWKLCVLAGLGIGLTAAGAGILLNLLRTGCYKSCRIHRLLPQPYP